jgi:hypothetical protein
MLSGSKPRVCNYQSHSEDGRDEDPHGVAQSGVDSTELRAFELHILFVQQRSARMDDVGISVIRGGSIDRGYSASSRPMEVVQWLG